MDPTAPGAHLTATSDHTTTHSDQPDPGHHTPLLNITLSNQGERLRVVVYFAHPHTPV